MDRSRLTTVEDRVLAGLEAADKTVRTEFGRINRNSIPGRLARASLDYDDLIQSGRLGLVQAAHRFQDGGAATFKSYAEKRVRGAALDELDRAERSRRRGMGREGRLELVSLEAASDFAPEEESRDGVLDLVDGMSALSKRERSILVLLAAGYTLAELAEPMEISIMRVSQIAAAARTKLKGAVHG